MTDVDIVPANMQQAAGAFAEGQWGIGFAWDGLATTLADCSGMAGHAPDKAALAFAPHYQKAAVAAWQAFRASVTSTGGIALCLGKTAGNYLNADHHSTITVTGIGPPTQAGIPLFGSHTQVVTDKTVPPPSSALGSDGSSLPGPLAKLWPTADTGKLRNAATAWRDAHDRLSTIAGRLSTAIGTATEGSDTSDAEAIKHVWSRVYGPCNDSTVLSALIDLCGGIARACTDYANAVDHARHKAEGALGGAGIVGLVVAGAGLIFTPATGGASDAGAATVNMVMAMSIMAPIMAALVATVAAIALGALADHIVQAAEESAAHAPKVKPSDADFHPNGDYEAGGKHKPTKTTTSRGDNSAEPSDGQEALDHSVQVKGTSPRRVGVDADSGEIVVLDQTHPGQDIYHGHVRSWKDLTDQMRNALIRNKLTDRRGKVLGNS